MTRGVDQIDQKARPIDALLDECHVVFTQLIEERDGTIVGGVGEKRFEIRQNQSWAWFGSFGKNQNQQLRGHVQQRIPMTTDDTHVDLMVIQRSCSSLRVSVKRVSPARAEAMMPAFDTSESVKVDFPWSTCAMTDMLRMLAFLSMMARIWSTVKFTCRDYIIFFD